MSNQNQRSIQFRQWSEVLKGFSYWGYLSEDEPHLFTSPMHPAGGAQYGPSEQFTGLYDKNGAKIWEGDIVRYDPGSGNIYKGVIKYLPVSYYGTLPNRSTPVFDMNSISEKRCEVIGNIHQNPKLLESNQNG